MSSSSLDLTAEEATELMKSCLGRIIAQQKQIDQLRCVPTPPNHQFTEVLIDELVDQLGEPALRRHIERKDKQYGKNFSPELALYLGGS